MITGAEYKAISDSIHEMQDSLANVESVSIDMQATVNALSLAYIGANPLLNFNNTSNEIDYFEDINNTLRGFEDSGSNFQSRKLDIAGRKINITSIITLPINGIPLLFSLEFFRVNILISIDSVPTRIIKMNAGKGGVRYQRKINGLAIANAAK